MEPIKLSVLIKNDFLFVSERNHFYFCVIKIITMKKLVAILLFVIFASVVLVSCKTAENCPAYSDASQLEVEVEEVA